MRAVGETKPIGIGLEATQLDHGVRAIRCDGRVIGYLFYTWASPSLRSWCDEVGIDCRDVRRFADDVFGMEPPAPLLPHETTEPWEAPHRTDMESAELLERVECQLRSLE